jgi:betaine reductase
MQRAMIIGKGSLFLGRMTNLFDGVSFVIEANTGKVSATAGDTDAVKRIVAEAMRQVAQSLLEEE